MNRKANQQWLLLHFLQHFNDTAVTMEDAAPATPPPVVAPGVPHATAERVKTKATYALKAWAKGKDEDSSALDEAVEKGANFSTVLGLILLKDADKNLNEEEAETRQVLREQKLIKLSATCNADEMQKLLTLRDKDGRMPIHVACHYGMQKEVVWLTKALSKVCGGADLADIQVSYNGQKDSAGLGPICVAAEAGHTVLLVEMYKGVEIEVGSGDSLKTELLRSAVDECARAVRIVARRDDLVSAEALFRADPQAFYLKDSANGMLPIHEASQGAPEDDGVKVLDRMLKEQLFEPDLLSSEEAHEQVLAKDAEGMLPIHHAAKSGKEAVAKLLLERGSEEAYEQVLAKDVDGMLPIHHAAKSGREAVARLLLVAQPGEIDTQDNKGNTPFHYACMEGWQARAYVLCTLTRTRACAMPPRTPPRLGGTGHGVVPQGREVRKGRYKER